MRSVSNHAEDAPGLYHITVMYVRTMIMAFREGLFSGGILTSTASGLLTLTSAAQWDSRLHVAQLGGAI